MPQQKAGGGVDSVQPSIVTTPNLIVKVPERTKRPDQHDLTTLMSGPQRSLLRAAPRQFPKLAVENLCAAQRRKLLNVRRHHGASLFGGELWQAFDELDPVALRILPIHDAHFTAID